MRLPGLSKLSYLHRASALAAAIILSALAPSFGTFAASTETVLHSFCQKTNCVDGSFPDAGLITDQSGILYGVTYHGGKNNSGVAFSLVPNASKTKWTYHILHNFCAKEFCSDGGYPVGELIIDTAGTLYGVTEQGGGNGGGVIYKLIHGANGWTEKVLWTFGCSCEGKISLPEAGLSYQGQETGLPWDQSSPLYGTTWVGGAADLGVVYELLPPGSRWKLTNIHSFESGSVNTDNPLLVDSSGNLFGVTSYGGTYGGGQLYKVAHGTWKVSVLHSFCKETNCSDGEYGRGRPAMDGFGNLFGVTAQGGTGNGSSVCAWSGVFVGCGVAFEYSDGIYGVINEFCSLPGCTDGAFPQTLIVGSSGDLFGTSDGIADTGSIGGNLFEISDFFGSYVFNTLYTFCSLENCADGQYPAGAIVQDSSGDLYGMTGAGGSGIQTGGDGTIFQVVH